ncbi:MAG: S8 family serine peptidase [Flavobacteriales bacterium]|nr:S8 family serine peptidase [Flavobacteriales bacterium]
MKKLFSAILLLLQLQGFSQNRYRVYFSDKDSTGFNPISFFDEKALQRRAIHGISPYCYSDLPVNPCYITQVSSLCDSTGYASRWFNMLYVSSSAERIEQIKQFPFVLAVEEVEELDQFTTSLDLSDLSPGEINLLRAQTTRMNAEAFKKAGIDGKGIRICVIDAGFSGMKETDGLDHLFRKNKIVETYDFVKKTKDVYHGHYHGTMVTSCIAGMADTIPIGLATEAEFLLARTEKTWSDKLREEENWLHAIEWADQHGAQVINSSLGYTSSRYFRADMNGKAGLISRAATIAARKGIIVVSSAGNEGDGAWKIVASPGDADSVLTVGAINPWTGLHATWSSYGPSTDKRIKPNVSAYGYTMCDSDGGLMEETGTSFASPLVAGFAACVLQMNPGTKNMEIISQIEQSADLYPYYDYAHGYGVPQADYFTDSTEQLEIERFHIQSSDLKFEVIIDSSSFTLAEPLLHYYYPYGENNSKKNQEDEWKEFHIDDRETSSSGAYCYPKFPDYLFYSVQNTEGYLKTYYVISVHQMNPLTLYKADFDKGEIVRIWYKGQMRTINF